MIYGQACPAVAHSICQLYRQPTLIHLISFKFNRRYFRMTIYNHKWLCVRSTARLSDTTR